MTSPLNLFYEEPDDDRWFPFDRYPRRVLRRIVRGKPRGSGHRQVFLNLCAGLGRLGVPYRVNDYGFAQRHPTEPVCIVGKPLVLDKIQWENPIVFGAAGYSHPLDDPGLLGRLPVRKILVPGEWMRRMCEPYWGTRVVAWPVGIDTARWSEPPVTAPRGVDFLLYHKVLWEGRRREAELVEPIRNTLHASGFTFKEIRYGHYRESDYHALLGECRAMIFLCEHETQGLAYQQALSRGVPIMAWDPGGPWQDPSYFPDRVHFEPVSSVPYWDERCGTKFRDAVEFEGQLREFWPRVQNRSFAPRQFVVDNLTLERCARRYVQIVQEAMDDSPS